MGIEERVTDNTRKPNTYLDYLYIKQNTLEKAKEQFEDIKGVIRIRRSKKDNTMAKRKGVKGQTTIYKALRIKLKIE